jgi:hypothetical protein
MVESAQLRQVAALSEPELMGEWRTEYTLYVARKPKAAMLDIRISSSE